MIHIQIDPHSGVPVYRQIMEQVKHYTASGIMKPGDSLPSIRALSTSLSVNPTTTVKAYTELQHEGVIEIKHGKGAFIAEAAKSITEEEMKEVIKRLARQLIVEASQIGADENTVRKIVDEQISEIGLKKEES